MKFRNSSATAITLVALLVAGTAGAHEIIYPEIVEADGEGHFSYEIIVEISDPIEFGSSYLDGGDNTDLGAWWADGFCMVVIEPGAYVTPVEGNLVDPAFDGLVYYEHYMCDNWTGVATTIILAPVVGAEAESWSAVKNLFD